ncbi:hypothetical protein [Pseudonocardia humida]|uniref:Lsr2 protein n=1 Tax=Pseudonocardia humida TaxID=2800819 RepID=A0ABT1AA16_9PSEU|nr:hypothetical protein [Pseudonocardia humida]MCO1659877.1 hypothetical protein [Pseudonocardia humida]
MDTTTLAGLPREAEEQHGRYEPTAPEHHRADWYAAFIEARRQGRTPEQAYRDASAFLEAARR